MSGPGSHIRPARLEDVGAVIALERVTAEAPHWPESEYATLVVPSVGGVRRCLFVAEREGGLAGFAVGKVVGTGTGSLAELESVAVSREVRRTGVGRALCVAVIGWCREEGAGTMELEVRSASAGVITLYSGLGFARVGVRPRYYRDPEDDAVLMRLDLAECE